MGNRTSALNLYIASSLAFGLMACNQRLQSTMQDPQNRVTQTEQALGIPADTTPDLSEHPVEVVPTPKEVPSVVTSPAEVKKKESQKEDRASASNFIIAAYNTMVKEGKKIGAACNLYVERVLEVLGFKTVNFLANDFDVAARKMFKSYKVFTFTNPTELKRHLWSYRERTGFILQWERTGGAPGHVAIVERVNEKIYIYQASLNKYTARLETTTLDRLLAVNNNKGVRVYSDFMK